MLKQHNMDESSTMSFNRALCQDWINLDHAELVELLIEKDKRIQDLEKLIEEQRRLRLQDSSQVEEKAAKIKEWVTKKLKELENQNKLLRDQNKKQKEVVDLLTMQMSSMSPMTSQNINESKIEDVHYIDQSIPSSPVNINQSPKLRRPQLKQRLQLRQHYSSDANNRLTFNHEANNNSEQSCIRLKHMSPSRSISSDSKMHTDTISIKSINTLPRNTGISLVSISQDKEKVKNDCHLNVNLQKQPGKESPLYDTVSIDPSYYLNENRAKQHRHIPQTNLVESNGEIAQEEPAPPPLPLHQSDKWERQLYNLAEQTFSALTHDIEASCQALSSKQLGCLNTKNAQQLSTNRQSNYKLKEGIRSIAKPSFTTIDGDEVIDGDDIENKGDDNFRDGSSNDDQINSKDQRSSGSTHRKSAGSFDYSTVGRRKSNDSNSEQTNLCQNLFSPMRSRTGKDSILRTQSIKKVPTPERLYDFMSADLVKRGCLIKHGALKSYQRWFVLKNFNLHTYKRESDETEKLDPSSTLKLTLQVQIQPLCHNNDGYPFKILCDGKQSLTLAADTIQARDEWVRMLTVAINLSDINPDCLTKRNSIHEGIVTLIRHGHSKKCHAILVSHLVFFVKSPIDPTPISYVSIKGSKIREVIDNYGCAQPQQVLNSENNSRELQDYSLAIYPRYSLVYDPIYITLGNQHETDEWFYQLSKVSGVDQTDGTQFERVLTHLMLSATVAEKSQVTINQNSSSDSCGSVCMWRENSVLLYSDKPIIEPLTSLPNETLKLEAVELFKSILLFTQVPIEQSAIDYHVCLLQNCFGRFLKSPELRNEFFAHLIKQSTYVRHRCMESKLSSSSASSGCSSLNQRESVNSLSPSTSDCQLVTDLQLLEIISADRELKCETRSIISHSQAHKERLDVHPQPEEYNPPSKAELLQVMQIMALAVSMNLPKGRIRWWLIDHLKKFANTETDVGKYASYTLKAIDRTTANGPRDNIPSRTEIMSILLRNPFDHSTPHSLPVNFEDNSYMIVGCDGSSLVEELMETMSRSVNIRSSELSDFYLFANDPSESKDTLHILEPQRKILDVVGWWEQTFKQQNCGRYQNTRVIKLYCRKRLILRSEREETEQERQLIVHQLNGEINSGKMPMPDALIVELAAIMTQLLHGDRSKVDARQMERILDKISTRFLPSPREEQNIESLASQVCDRWSTLTGRSANDCVRVYLNCIRRFNG